MEGGRGTNSGSTPPTDMFVPGNGVRTGVKGVYVSVGVGSASRQGKEWFAGSQSNALCRGLGVSGTVPVGKSVPGGKMLCVVVCLVECGIDKGDECCTSRLALERER
jgi:hypothetical protein